MVWDGRPAGRGASVSGGCVRACSTKLGSQKQMFTEATAHRELFSWYVARKNALSPLCFTTDNKMMIKVTREECGVKEDVATKIEKNMLRCFSHVERMGERRLTKEIY
jgi:hypothetical protein